MDRMHDAQSALREAATHLPDDVNGRLTTVAKLSDTDRDTIVELARQALAQFQPKPAQEKKT
jgi:F-type H+-transporting ATPase subunit alpha